MRTADKDHIIIHMRLKCSLFHTKNVSSSSNCAYVEIEILVIKRGHNGIIVNVTQINHVIQVHELWESHFVT